MFAAAISMHNIPREARTRAPPCFAAIYHARQRHAAAIFAFPALCLRGRLSRVSASYRGGVVAPRDVCASRGALCRRSRLFSPARQSQHRAAHQHTRSIYAAPAQSRFPAAGTAPYASLACTLCLVSANERQPPYPNQRSSPPRSAVTTLRHHAPENE